MTRLLYGAAAFAAALVVIFAGLGQLRAASTSDQCGRISSPLR